MTVYVTVETFQGARDNGPSVSDRKVRAGRGETLAAGDGHRQARIPRRQIGQRHKFHGHGM